MLVTMDDFMILKQMNSSELFKRIRPLKLSSVEAGKQVCVARAGFGSRRNNLPLGAESAHCGGSQFSTRDVGATQSPCYSCSIKYPRFCNSTITLCGPEK